MRRPFISANWKMYKTIKETTEFFKEFLPLVKDVKDVDIVIGVPALSIYKAVEMTKGSNVSISAENLYFEKEGAFTGEISADMVLDAGCPYTIVGHSERRQYFNESDELLNKKTKAGLAAGLKVIFCIGETLPERESGKLEQVLSRQINEGLKDIAPDKLVIAYEPVWAIGTGVTATPEQAQEAHAFVRSKLKVLYGAKADDLRILYGGSVKPNNVKELMSKPDIDGALVGGASLKADSFSQIVKFK
jgi:triosephosphate isomerase